MSVKGWFVNYLNSKICIPTWSVVETLKYYCIYFAILLSCCMSLAAPQNQIVSTHCFKFIDLNVSFREGLLDFDISLE